MADAITRSTERGWDRQHLLALANRCETGAAEMEKLAENAQEALAERGYPHEDWVEWAARKRGAAAAARAYAHGLRDEAAAMADSDKVSEQRIAQAQMVADAAHVDGILIDNRLMAERAVEETAGSSRAEKAQAQAAYAAEKAAAVEGSGVFTLIEEPGQVSFWQLGTVLPTLVRDRKRPEPRQE